MFSSSEFISLNQTDSCGVIPTEFTAIQNLTVHVRKGCVQFYSNNDCSGEDVQLLVTYDTRELTQRGFRSPVRSFSHCNSKCINKISVRNAEGRRILEDEPGGVGFRLVYESGKLYNLSMYIASPYNWAGFIDKFNKGIQIYACHNTARVRHVFAH